MKASKFLSAGLLLLALGFAAPIYSQQQDDKNKQPPPKQAEPPKQEAPRHGPPTQAPPAQHPTQQAPKEQPAKPQPTQQPKQQPTKAPTTPQHPTTTTRPTQSSGGAYHGGVKTAEPTNGGVHPSGVPQHQGQARSGFLQSRATSWSSQHKTWQQRGGYNGYRIPDDRFSLYFGSNHFFHIGSLPMLFVGGYPRFQYDGYWITFVDPWPEDWSPTWYETDNLYLAYDDGYYLYDTNYPGIGIAVTISM
jgi:hypothetical protein